MESAQRIESLYRDTLEPRLAALESLRTSVKGYITKSALCVGLPFALVLSCDTAATMLGLSSTAATLLGDLAPLLIFSPRRNEAEKIARSLDVHPSTVGRWFTPPVKEPETTTEMETTP